MLKKLLMVMMAQALGVTVLTALARNYNGAAAPAGRPRVASSLAGLDCASPGEIASPGVAPDNFFRDAATNTPEAVGESQSPRVVIANKQKGADIGAKINAADALLGPNKGEIWAYDGGTISTQVVVSSNHTLKLFPGTYAATCPAPVIMLKDNAALTGDGWGAILQETTAEPYRWFVVSPFNGYHKSTRPGAQAQNITVSNIQIKGAGTTYDSSLQAVSMGNCHNCLVDKVWVNGTHAIGIQVGGRNEDGLYAQNVRVTNCLLTNVASQNIAVVNSKNVVVSNCAMRQMGYNDPIAPGLVAVDIEPNAGDVLEDVTVDNCVIDASEQDYYKVLNAVAVQNGNGVKNFGPVQITNNKIIGAKFHHPYSRVINAGIRLISASRTSLVKNQITRCAWGVWETTSHDNIFRDNVIESSGGNGTSTWAIENSYSSVYERNVLRVNPQSINAHGEKQDFCEYGGSQNNKFLGNRSQHSCIGKGSTIAGGVN